MTLKDITNQLYSLTGGKINSTRFTKSNLKNYIYKMVEPYTPFLIEVTLSDGKWWCFINLTKEYCYDYQIAETREQEKCMLEKFFGEKYAAED